MPRSDFPEGDFKPYKAAKTVHLGVPGGLSRPVLKDSIALFDGTTVIIVNAGKISAGKDSPGGDRFLLPAFQQLIDLGCFIDASAFYPAALEVADEGIILSREVEQINFEGSSVVAELDSGNPEIVKVTITGGGGSPTLSLEAGENLVVGDILTINGTGQAIKAESSFAADNWGVTNIALQNAAATTTLNVASEGALVDVRFTAAPPASSNGDYVFLNSVPGTASVIPPMGGGNIVFIIGVLQGADGVSTTPSVIFQPRYVSRRP